MLNRIVPEKRVKMVIEAFNELDIPLKIAGEADESAKRYANECKKLSNDNIEFLGWVGGDDKIELLAQSSGLVFAAEREDFGMPPIEALAAGKPVVGVNEGFTKHQIVDGENGVAFTPTKSDLKRAVEDCIEKTWSAKQLQDSSRRYDVRAVRQKWMSILRDEIDSGENLPDS
jgi:glycosyltransferase involved in cell wall biosynthesis